MDLYFLRLFSLVAIALVYMLFDIFNKRNVPSIFAYATLAYGYALTILYFDLKTIALSVAISFVVMGLGYIVYRIGQLGAADVIEFAALSLILPIQGAPLLLPRLGQFGFPFILSLLINAGIAALVLVPIYYLPKARKKLKKPLASYISRENKFVAMLLGTAYAAFIIFMAVVAGVGIIGLGVLVLMMVSSIFVTIFSIPITYAMVEDTLPKNLENGDIIAVNLMEKKDVKTLKSKLKSFDKLVTGKLIDEIKAKKFKDKLPVYKKALPFAVPIFIGLIVSLGIGNLVLLVLKV